MSLPQTVPVAGTAVRPAWTDLPPAVRAWIEQAVGSRVRTASSQGSGFTPGFASRLQLADGRRVFVKAASEAVDWLINSYRTEAAKLALIPAAVPAPRLEQLLDDTVDGVRWLALVFEDVDGRPPQRPWRPDEARSALRTAVIMAEALTPAPPGWPWDPLAGEILEESPDWAGLRDRVGWTDHAEDLRAYAERRSELLTGDTLVHLDCRDDNLIIDASGHTWICDWNFPAVGPRWADAVCVAIAMFGDGLDAEALLAETALITDDDREGVDCLLAVLTAYFLFQSVQPANPTSPYLRTHQIWYAQACGSWLKRRLGWT